MSAFHFWSVPVGEDVSWFQLALPANSLGFSVLAGCIVVSFVVVSFVLFAFCWPLDPGF